MIERLLNKKNFFGSVLLRKLLLSCFYIQDYKLGSSANVSIVKKALMEKDLIVKEGGELRLAEPMLGLWLQH